MPYEAIDKIRSFKTEVKEILDDYEDKFITNVEKIKEDIDKIDVKIKNIEKNFMDYHNQIITKVTSIVEKIEKETLKNLTEARTKKWS